MSARFTLVHTSSKARTRSATSSYRHVFLGLGGHDSSTRLRLPQAHRLHGKDNCRYCRFFHTSRTRLASSAASFPDHYNTLSVPPNAPSSEIKKAFFGLSKKHHPDRTRDLPSEEAEAHSNKFLAISEAYNTLGDQARREKYDRERAAHTGGPAGGNGYAGDSSGTSWSPGGRRASGLSRRRSQFRGPPPSFYRSGGWGPSASKRQQAQNAERRQSAQDKANAGEPGPTSEQQQQNQHQQGRGEDDAWPFATDPNDVPHFDRGAHFRSQSTVEQQLSQGRARRRRKLFENAQDDMIFPDAGPEFRSFILVGGIMALGLAGPLVFILGVR